LKELALKFECSVTAINNALKKLKITYKKKEPQYLERDEISREKFIALVKEIEDEPETQIFYTDETGIDKFLYRDHGRAPRGTKIYAQIKGKKFKRTSIVAGKCGNKVVAPLVYNGTMSSKFYTYWFANCLCKSLNKGDVVILDNATVHKKIELSEVAKEHDFRIIFQPSYSPDLNKIEKFWGWLKKKLGKILCEDGDPEGTLDVAISKAFKSYSDEFCHTFQV
jgi:transposase